MAKQGDQARLENLVAEQMVLGKLIQSETGYWSVSEILHAGHFAKVIHQRIYQAIKDILTDGKLLSIALLESRLGPTYDDDDKSVPSLLTALLRDADNNEDALDQVEVVIDLWRRRKMITYHQEGLRAAQDARAISVDLLQDATVRLDDIARNSEAAPLLTIGQLAKNALTKSTIAQTTGVAPGFDTGLPSLDEILGRIHPGDLGVIAAQQGFGKTVLGAQLAKRAALFGPVLFFQLEMTGEDMARRLLASEANLSVSKIEEGDYTSWEAEELKAAQQRIDAIPMLIDARPKLALERMRDRALYIKRSKGLVCVVVDHMRLVRIFGKVRDKFERMEMVSSEAKKMAKELEVPMIVLSQVTRESQKRANPVPQMTDLDGGGALEQDADWAIALFRRDLWLKAQEPPEDHDATTQTRERVEWAKKMAATRDKIEIWNLKRRRGKSGEMREFVFDGRRSRISEVGN